MKRIDKRLIPPRLDRFAVASVLLNFYAHFLPTEIGGFADALTALYGTKP